MLPLTRLALCLPLSRSQEDCQAFGPQAPLEIQFEFFVPLQFAKEALTITGEHASQWGTLALYNEVRVIAADNLWLSPSTIDGQDTLAIAFGMDKEQEPAAMKAAGKLEAALAQFGAKPHWAKLTTLSLAQLEERYGEKLVKFRKLAAELDPAGKFKNEWSKRYVLGK